MVLTLREPGNVERVLKCHRRVRKAMGLLKVRRCQQRGPAVEMRATAGQRVVVGLMASGKVRHCASDVGGRGEEKAAAVTLRLLARLTLRFRVRLDFHEIPDARLRRSGEQHFTVALRR